MARYRFDFRTMWFIVSIVVYGVVVAGAVLWGQGLRPETYRVVAPSVRGAERLTEVDTRIQRIEQRLEHLIARKAKHE